MKRNDLVSVGDRIRQARKEKGLSQNELAEMIDISTPYLSDMERGRKNYSVSILMDLTEALHVSADWLLRTNTPQTSHIHSKELNSLLEDCTPTEVEALLHILSETKSVFHNTSRQ